jgi:hypothetical protein
MPCGGTAGWLRGRRAADGGQQDADDQAGLETLAQPDQQIRNTACPCHAN